MKEQRTEQRHRQQHSQQRSQQQLVPRHGFPAPRVSSQQSGLKGLEFIPIGGYSEVGRNCCAVRVDDEVFILDMGLAVDKYIALTEQEEYGQVKLSGKRLIEFGAAPDVEVLGPLKNNVKAILITHAHLDHMAAVPYLANRFHAPIYATPFTKAILRTITDGEKMPLREQIIEKNPGDRFRLTKSVEGEFIYVTHSTPQAVIVALHTKYGTVLYANDFKFDEHPTKGPRTDSDRLKQLRGAKLLVLDSLYAHKNEKAPSENYARSMLFNVLTKESTEGKIVIATTFSSHIYRLQTLAEVAERIGRRPVFLGRSIGKYVQAAEELDIAHLPEKAEHVPFGSKVRSALKRIRDPERCLFITTGNQGEPKAVLHKMITGDWLPFRKDDLVVFSCITIPVEPNITYRAKLEEEITKRGMNILRDVHVSGHGAREDHRRLLKLVKPQHIVPTHGGMKQLFALKELAVKELKYRPDQVHILKNNERLRL